VKVSFPFSSPKPYFGKTLFRQKFPGHRWQRERSQQLAETEMGFYVLSTTDR
jgi:hypothetical protein